MTDFQARNPAFEQRVRESFARQSFMKTIGAELAAVCPGSVEIRLPYREDLCQQHGYFHGGVIGSLADNVGGYAAFSLMQAQDSVLTVEYKMNIVAPGDGEALIAYGRVLRPGRSLTVCKADVYASKGGQEKLCATALCTLMTLTEQSDGPERHREKTDNLDN